MGTAPYLEHKINSFFLQTWQPSPWCCCPPPLVERPLVKRTPRKPVACILVACIVVARILVVWIFVLLFQGILVNRVVFVHSWLQKEQSAASKPLCKFWMLLKRTDFLSQFFGFKDDKSGWKERVSFYALLDFPISVLNMLSVIFRGVRVNLPSWLSREMQ